MSFVLALFVPTVLVLAAAACRALCEGWREHKEWSAIREREQVSRALR